mgnify:CR=1 FL=1
MAKDQSPIDVEVVYCGAWGGLPEANYASSVIRTVFPNAKINQYTPGKTSNLVIKYSGNVIYDKKAGDGKLTEQNAAAFAKKLKGLVAGGKWEKGSETIEWKSFGKHLTNWFDNDS